ncbi:MAG: hypothetical protein ACRD1K_20595 [Acidimicrobiales bacterium]
MKADPHLMTLLWSAALVGRLELPVPGLPKAYWQSYPRVLLDRRRVRELLMHAGMDEAIVALTTHRVILCLN